jgi:hypothetical protein
MSIKTNGSRQYPLVARLPISFDDLALADAGVAQVGFNLPGGSTIIGGAVVVSTVFNSSGGTPLDTLDVGDSIDPDRYTASVVDLTSLGRTALTLTGYETVGGTTIDVTWDNGTATTLPTTGEAYVEIQYVQLDRANENVPG